MTQRTPLTEVTHLWARFAYIVAILILSCSAHVHAASTSDQAELRIAAAAQQLQRYNASHSLSDLRSTVSLMGGTVDVGSLTPQNFIARRRTLVQEWAQILKAVEQSYDPTFNPNSPADLPKECLIPPREATGIQQRSCADPSDVKDPQARAAYVAALQENAVKVKRLSYYHDLRNIDDWAMLSLRMSLDLLNKIAPESASPDFAALDAILQAAGISPARRSKVDAMFYSRPGP